MSLHGAHCRSQGQKNPVKIHRHDPSPFGKIMGGDVAIACNSSVGEREIESLKERRRLCPQFLIRRVAGQGDYRRAIERSEERRVGKEWVRTCRSGLSQDLKKKKKKQ